MERKERKEREGEKDGGKGNELRCCGKRLQRAAIRPHKKKHNKIFPQKIEKILLKKIYNNLQEFRAGKQQRVSTAAATVFLPPGPALISKSCSSHTRLRHSAAYCCYPR